MEKHLAIEMWIVSACKRWTECANVCTLYAIVQHCKKFLSHLVLEFIQKSGKYLEMEFSKIQIDLVAVVIVMVLGYHYPLLLHYWSTGIAMAGNMFVRRLCAQQLAVCENWKNAKWMKEFANTTLWLRTIISRRTCIRPPTAIDLIKQEVVSVEKPLHFKSNPKGEVWCGVLVWHIDVIKLHVLVLRTMDKVLRHSVDILHFYAFSMKYSWYSLSLFDILTLTTSKESFRQFCCIRIFFFIHFSSNQFNSRARGLILWIASSIQRLLNLIIHPN